MFKKKYSQLCLLVLVWIPGSRTDSFFVSNKYRTSEYKCVTNSSYALSWIDQEAAEPFQTVSQFIPPYEPSNFDCNITDDHKTRTYYANRYWSLKKSSEANIKEVVLDRRWEEFRTIKTPFTRYSERLVFEPRPVPLPKNDFDISFAVIADEEVHVFLCDGPEPPQSNCYWFSLQSSNSAESSIRKCERGTIPSTTAQEPPNPCKVPLVRIEHPTVPYFLYKNQGTNFRLTKNGNHISLTHIADEDTLILEMVDREKVIAITHMVLHSKEEDALWMVHNDENEITTEAVTNGTLHFEVVPLQYDFEIPISVRTEKEAHIFLCDGPYPPEANCYWLMLEAFNGKASVIRKCVKNAIPAITNRYPTRPCKTPLVTVKHSEKRTYLSSDVWVHFKLSKKNNRVSIDNVGDDNSETIIKWTDPTEVINVTHVVFNSRLVNGLWKIHEVDYVFTHEEMKNVPLGPPISPVNGTICISMFVAQCRLCVLMLTLMEQGRLISEQFYWAQPQAWSEIKFVVDNIQGSGFILAVSTSGRSHDRFWAIDNVRQCRKQEYRMISANKKADCQLLRDESNLIEFDNSKLVGTINHCPEDTIGGICVPCNWIYKDCQRISICSKNRTSESECFCSAGFENYNECYYKCNLGFYGHGCKSRCGSKCRGHCDHISGTCSSCIDNYTGPKCEILRATYFVKAPEITDINYTKAKIHVTNFDVQYTAEDDQPFSYDIQYKEADPLNQTWITFSSHNRFYQRKTIEINQLKADTTYLVRCVTTTLKNQTYSGNQIPVATFRTACEEISDNNVYVRPSNTSVNISLLRTSEVTCGLDRYEIYIFNVGSPKASDENSVYFDRLTPFTNYTAVFQSESNRFEKQFHTTEGVPQRVQNLRVTRIRPTNVELQWDKPSAIYGKLQYYVIEYQHVSHLGCKQQIPYIIPTVQTETKPSVRIDDLVPFSQYSFSVYAVNTRLNIGVPTTIPAITLPSDQIGIEEIPEVLEIIPGIHTASVKLSRVECSSMEGPLMVEVTPNCTDEWRSPPITTSYPMPLEELAVGRLIPYSNYTLELKFCRNETVCSKDIVKRKFQTRPSVSQSVTNLAAYSTDESTISLRWKPPYPPTGSLILYKIIYYYYDKRRSKVANLLTIAPTSCTVWPDFHCAELALLRNNTEYVVQVLSRNLDPANFSAPVETTAVTKRGSSDAPYDLKVDWKAEDMEVCWKHPNKTNGKIEFFDILVTPMSSPGTRIPGYRLPVTEDTYNLTYCYKIKNQDVLPSQHYRFAVSAFNGYRGKDAVILDKSPPELLLLSDDAQFTSTDRTITVNFTVQEPRYPSLIQKVELKLLISNQNSTMFRYPQLGRPEASSNLKVVAQCNLQTFGADYSITIGNNKQLNYCVSAIKDPPLLSGTPYNVTLHLTNVDKDPGKSRVNVYSYIYDTTGGRQIINYNVYNFNFHLFKL